MRLSEFLMPTLKENPAEAHIASHRYMMRSGMIRQSSAGIYSWLPLGFRVLKKIEKIVREEQDRAGAQELLMPTIQPATIWQESGRYEDYGKEMLRIIDRHNREMLYGPTNEELITDINGNGTYDDGEDEYVDSDNNGKWNEIEKWEDSANGSYDEGEEFNDCGFNPEHISFTYILATL